MMQTAVCTKTNANLSFAGAKGTSSPKKRRYKPSRAGKERPRKDCNHRPRPMNPFMVWQKEQRPIVQARCPHLQNHMVSITLGQLWKRIPLAEREKYKQKSSYLGSKHKEEFPDYKYKPKSKKKSSSLTSVTPDIKSDNGNSVSSVPVRKSSNQHQQHDIRTQKHPREWNERSLHPKKRQRQDSRPEQHAADFRPSSHDIRDRLEMPFQLTHDRHGSHTSETFENRSRHQLNHRVCAQTVGNSSGSDMEYYHSDSTLYPVDSHDEHYLGDHCDPPSPFSETSSLASSYSHQQMTDRLGAFGGGFGDPGNTTFLSVDPDFTIQPTSAPKQYHFPLQGTSSAWTDYGGRNSYDDDNYSNDVLNSLMSIKSTPKAYTYDHTFRNQSPRSHSQLPILSDFDLHGLCDSSPNYSYW